MRPTHGCRATQSIDTGPAQTPLVVPTTERLRWPLPAAPVAQRRQNEASDTHKNVLRHRSAGGIAPQAIRTGQSLTRSTEVCGRPLLPARASFSAFFRPSFALLVKIAVLQIAKVDDLDDALALLA